MNMLHFTVTFQTHTTSKHNNLHELHTEVLYKYLIDPCGNIMLSLLPQSCLRLISTARSKVNNNYYLLSGVPLNRNLLISCLANSR